jgi:hypothetical protein
LQGKTAKRTRKAWALFMLAIGLPEPGDGVAKVHAIFFYTIDTKIEINGDADSRESGGKILYYFYYV